MYDLFFCLQFVNSDTSRRRSCSFFTHKKRVFSAFLLRFGSDRPRSSLCCSPDDTSFRSDSDLPSERSFHPQRGHDAASLRLFSLVQKGGPCCEEGVNVFRFRPSYSRQKNVSIQLKGMKEHLGKMMGLH